MRSKILAGAAAALANRWSRRTGVECAGIGSLVRGGWAWGPGATAGANWRCPRSSDVAILVRRWLRFLSRLSMTRLLWQT